MDHELIIMESYGECVRIAEEVRAAGGLSLREVWVDYARETGRTYDGPTEFAVVARNPLPRGVDLDHIRHVAETA